MSGGWELVRLDDLDRVPVADAGIVWRPIRRRLGIAAFGINAYSADAAGDHVVEPHTEEALRHEEVYVVVRGRARFVLDGEEVDVPAGALVHVRDPAVRREAVAEEAGTLVLAVGGAPGQAYEPSAWEWYFAAAPFHAAGEYERGLEILRQGLEAKPEHPVMLYQVACYEALTGRTEAALEHLARAVELRPAVVEWAAGDRDLDAIRDDPRFPA